MPKREQIEPMFSTITPYYDQMNDLMTLGLHRLWKKMAIVKAQLKPGDTHLDLCCGTGDLAILAAKKVGQNGKVVGLDFCASMIEAAQKKSQRKNFLKICYQQADVQSIPLENETVNATTIAFGIRNTENPTQVLKEIYRVLKPNGKFICLEASEVKIPFIAFFAKIYTFKIIPCIIRLLGKNTDAYQYLPRSIQNFWSSNEMEKQLKDLNFKKIRKQKLMFGATTLYSAEK